MPGEWIECKLADACSRIDYGLTASASHGQIGPRFLRITDIVSGHIDWKTVPFVAADEETTRKYRLQDGDIVLARTGASTGVSSYVHNPPLALFASYLVRLRAKPDFDPQFLAYYLKSDPFWSYIRGVLGDKSAQPNASASTMTKAPLHVPRDKHEQRAISDILGALDDKIELNRRMNETLEAMARAIFKSWFVRFDPVRAKAEGRQPFGMDAGTAALFPDMFQSSRLGRIPKGWRIEKLDQVVEIIGGGTPKTTVPEYWGGDIPWFSVLDAPRPSDVFIIDTEKKITKAGLDTSSARSLPERTTIISARGTVGKLALVGTPMAMNQSCYGVRPQGRRGEYFTYFLMRGRIGELSQSTHGTVFDTITRDTFKIVDTVTPTEDLTRRYDAVVEPLMERMRLNLIESKTLAAIRDALLPKLISGEIRVKYAEKLTEKAL